MGVLRSRGMVVQRSRMSESSAGPWWMRREPSSAMIPRFENTPLTTEAASRTMASVISVIDADRLRLSASWNSCARRARSRC